MKHSLDQELTKTLIDTLAPSGDVLEICFSHRYGESHIQNFHPKSHTIIETDPSVLREASEWTHQHKNVKLIQTPWKNALPQLGQYNAILFNQMAKVEEPQAEGLSQAQSLLKKEQELYRFVDEKLPGLFDKEYSDKDLEEFFKALDPAQKSNISPFLYELWQGGQINAKQYEEMHKRHNLKKEMPKPRNKPARRGPNVILELLTESLKHLVKGGKFACFLSQSNYEDPQFVRQIIMNPNLNYHEKTVTLSGKDEWLIMIVEKLA